VEVLVIHSTVVEISRNQSVSVSNSVTVAVIVVSVKTLVDISVSVDIEKITNVLMNVDHTVFVWVVVVG
jgi:hypothetical protein